jgi:hypothetical protein
MSIVLRNVVFNSDGRNVAGHLLRRMQPHANAVERMLAAVGKQRTAEARGAVSRRVAWLPSPEEAQAAGIQDQTLLNAIDYYATPRGHSDHRSNRRLFYSTTNT